MTAYDLTLEIRRRCVENSEAPPSRNTVARRWAAHREAEGLAHPIKLAPGNFVVKNPMDVVQVDHTSRPAPSFLSLNPDHGSAKRRASFSVWTNGCAAGFAASSGSSGDAGAPASGN